MQKTTFVVLLALSSLFFSCQKETVQPIPLSPGPTPVVNGPTPDELLKDSIQLITKDIYLWNTQLPASFDARGYADPEKVMESIRPFSLEPGFAQPVDRFSFAVKKTEWDNMSAGFSNLHTAFAGTGDIGITVFFRAAGDLRVRLVEPASPAGMAGIQRGWRILSINGNNNITTSNADFIVEKIYNSSTVTISFQKPDGSSVSVDLAQAVYATRPVYLDTIYQVNNKKIGYLVFNSFLGNTTQLNNELQRVFGRFGSQQVDDVIIDLRYNGGGFVSVQERMANYLVNSSANGSIMMKQEYNAANASSNVTTRFNKMGSLNLNRVYFIVGRATASASELLINNLKPYMEVNLVGGTTNGKPVGFFPIPVGEWYILPVSFRTTNRHGAGNYFNGLQVNNVVADGLDKDWGDLQESSLASAIRNITTGLYRSQSQPTYVEPTAVATGNQVLEAPMLKLTVAEK